MKRIGVAFFYDEQSIVDEYMFFLIDRLSKFTERHIFVSNSDLDDDTKRRLIDLGCEVIVRENRDFDVGAYKHAIEHIGYDRLGDYDELILYNHTFYGPIYPFEEMFTSMARTACDFWGITSHKEMVPNPFTNTGTLPRHINSHFIAIRKSMSATPEFSEYWLSMPEILTYIDSVLKHESRFTAHFESLGFVAAVYDDDVNYGTEYPCFMSVDEAVRRRCPILKRRIFFHDPTFHEQNAIDLPRALSIIRETSDYNEQLIWQNILRCSTLRTLNTTAALTSILPDMRVNTQLERRSTRRIAVCAHVYYDDMIDELLAWCEHIPAPYAFVATTDTREKARRIEARLSEVAEIDEVIVRVLEVNRGRDMSSLFVACRDIFTANRYDLVCRIHTKKSPQVAAARSNLFKRHMFENLLSSEGFVENVLDMFEEKPWLGLAVPPVVHISFPTMGGAWFSNKTRAIETAGKLGLKVKLDDHTPVAAYGTMFWFRPQALQKLFEYPWKWEEFNAEPDHSDGGLAHVLERLIAYAAQDAGYTTQQILCQRQAETNYAMLEFKHAQLASHMRWNFPWQNAMLAKWEASGYPIDPTVASSDSVYSGAYWNRQWSSESNGQTGGELNDPWLVNAYNEKRKQWRHERSSRRSILKIFKPISYSFTERDVRLVHKFLLEAGNTCVAGSHFEGIKRRIRHYLAFGWHQGEELFRLFDADYYMERYGSEVDVSPLVHYLRVGGNRGYDPHPLFDTAWVLAQLPSRGSRNPVLHFLKSPPEAAVSPHPFFDSRFYMACYPAVVPAHFNPVIHYLAHGAEENFAPHPLFDSSFYTGTNPGILKEGINPLIHYLTVGEQYSRDPHPLFDVDYYRDRNSAIMQEDSPLRDFILHGSDGSRQPHPLFEAAIYHHEYLKDAQPVINPLVHYLSEGSRKHYEPGGSFEAKFYANANPEVAESGMDPLRHYVLYGANERRPAHSLFDEKYYVRRYPEVTRLTITPYQHYLKYGAAEGRNPSADFDTKFYLSTYPEVAKTGVNPIAHYAVYGRRNGFKTRSEVD
ncbi:hypothetical protein BTE77_26355 [Ensifer adhaerens]|nr:hypothetical protein BTE77_26355 [Ensifer adhaerens]